MPLIHISHRDIPAQPPLVTHSIDNFVIETDHRNYFNTEVYPDSYPYSLEAYVTITNSGQGFAISLGPYYNPGPNLYHAAITIHNGVVRAISNYSISPSYSYFTGMTNIATLTVGQPYHFAVELFDENHFRIAIDGVWVATLTASYSTLLPNGLPRFGCQNMGLGDENQLFSVFDLTGTITDYKYYHKQLVWKGVDFTPNPPSP